MNRSTGFWGPVVATTIVGLLVALTSLSVRAQDEEACRDETPRLDKYAFLRAASLDLRGVVPTVEEYEALDELDEVPAEWLEEWTRTTDYQERVVRRHRALLWSTASNVSLMERSWRLGSFRVRPSGAEPYDIYLRNRSGEVYRGNRGTRCLDEPARFDEEGQIICTTETLDSGREVCREGWVELNPFWAPEDTIRVCAYDAQAATHSPDGRACNLRSQASNPECGCGPEMKWCLPNALERRLRGYLAEDFDRRVMANIAEDEPYHELLSGRRAFVNGPMAHFFREQANLFDNVPLVPGAVDVDRLPEMNAADADTWEEIGLPEYHAGLLTSAVFLVRFQTNRARANRFYDAFLCQPFQPPPGGIPFDDEEAASEPDLQVRTGCNYCHALLEPAAAHWGRWTQQGGGYLAAEDYPALSQECIDCSMGLFTCSDECRRHYLTNARTPEQRPYLGMLRAYEFLRLEHYENVVEGPRRLVQDTVVDNRFPTCAVSRTAEWLFGRELREDESDWVQGVSQVYFDGEFRYRDLSLAVINSETYRRVR